MRDLVQEWKVYPLERTRVSAPSLLPRHLLIRERSGWVSIVAGGATSDPATVELIESFATPDGPMVFLSKMARYIRAEEKKRDGRVPLWDSLEEKETVFQAAVAFARNKRKEREARRWVHLPA